MAITDYPIHLDILMVDDATPDTPAERITRTYTDSGSSYDTLHRGGQDRPPSGPLPWSRTQALTEIAVLNQTLRQLTHCYECGFELRHNDTGEFADFRNEDDEKIGRFVAHAQCVNARAIFNDTHDPYSEDWAPLFEEDVERERLSEAQNTQWDVWLAWRRDRETRQGAS